MSLSSHKLSRDKVTWGGVLLTDFWFNYMAVCVCVCVKNLRIVRILKFVMKIKNGDTLEPPLKHRLHEEVNI